MKVMLAEPFKSLWAGRDAFAEVEALKGESIANWKPGAPCARRWTVAAFS